MMNIIKEDETIVTPLSIADKTINECCRSKGIIEDVIFYLRAYLRREFGADDITDMLDKEIKKAAVNNKAEGSSL